MADISTYAPRSGRLIDESGNTINIAETVDPTRNAFVSMPVLNKLIFDGYVFSGFAKYTITASATSYLQIKTGDDAVCFIVDAIVTNGDQLVLKLFEAPTVTDGSTAVALLNRNRSSSNTVDTQAYSDPTGVSGGTQLDEYYLGGTYGQKIVGGEQLGTQLPLKLETNTDYVLSLTNDGASDSDILIRFTIVKDS